MDAEIRGQSVCRVDVETRIRSGRRIAKRVGLVIATRPHAENTGCEYSCQPVGRSGSRLSAGRQRGKRESGGKEREKCAALHPVPFDVPDAALFGR
jgi:hypothetical protein